MAKGDSKNQVITFLIGRYEQDATTCLFGPGGSGKTLMCILAFIDTVTEGKKIIFIDTENGFSIERLKQIAPNYRSLLKDLIFFKPGSFQELTNMLSTLSIVVNEKIGMIIVDTLTNFYRIEISKTSDKKQINSELAQQFEFLSEIRKKFSIPILITTQVYADFDQKDRVLPIGGDIIKGRCKTLIELEKLHKNMRRATLIKNRYEDPNKNVVFEIVQKGVKLN